MCQRSGGVRVLCYRIVFFPMTPQLRLAQKPVYYCIIDIICCRQTQLPIERALGLARCHECRLPCLGLRARLHILCILSPYKLSFRDGRPEETKRRHVLDPSIPAHGNTHDSDDDGKPGKRHKRKVRCRRLSVRDPESL